MKELIKRIKQIFERNPDTGTIRSRKPGDYGNEVDQYNGKTRSGGLQNDNKKNTTNG